MRKKFTRLIETICIVGIASIISLSCGGGGGDGGGGSTSTSSWKGSFNSDGYPEVAGEYSFKTSTFSVACSDGSSGPSDSLSMTLDIAQKGYQLKLASYNPLPSNITISQENELSGTVDYDGNFILSRSIVAAITGYSGNFTVTYTVKGTFSTSGWSGTYQFTMYNDVDKASCTATATFTGNLQSEDTREKTIPGINEAGQSDIRSVLAIMLGYQATRATE